VKIAVFGAGYVGLVTAACLAGIGHTVACVDVDPAKVARIQAGEPPIYEPGLEELLNRGLSEGRFSATTDPAEALADAELSLIAVGTPDREGRIDLRYVLEVAGLLGDHLRKVQDFHTVVVKSTVIPGTTEGPIREVLEARSGKRAGLDFGLGMNPEFLREASAVQDFADPDRVVLGALGEGAAEAMAAVYAPFQCRKMVVSLTEAEFIKYTSNALLSTLISFSNEIFNLCEAMPGVEGRTVLEPPGGGSARGARHPGLRHGRGGLRGQLLPQGHERPGGHGPRSGTARTPAGCGHRREPGASRGHCRSSGAGVRLSGRKAGGGAGPGLQAWDR